MLKTGLHISRIPRFDGGGAAFAISDDFDRANGDLGADWVGDLNWNINSNNAKKTVAGSEHTIYNAEFPSSDMSITAPLSSATFSAANAAITLRSNLARTQYFSAGWFGTEWRITRNTSTVLESVPATWPGVTTTLRFEAEGNFLRFYVDDELILQAEDTLYQDASHLYGGLYAETSAITSVEFTQWSGSNVLETIPTTYAGLAEFFGGIAYWSLDELAGNFASVPTDYPGTDVGGVIRNQTPLMSSGKAIDLDGTADYVSIANNAVFNPGLDNFSISVWMKPANVNQYLPVISKRPSGSPFNMYQLGTGTMTTGFGSTPSKRIYFIIYDGSTNGTAWNTDDFVVDGTAFHAVVARNGTSSIKMYVNGVEKTLSVGHTLGGAINMSNTAALKIGHDAGTDYFDSPVDGFSFHDKYITASMAKQLYEAGS